MTRDYDDYCRLGPSMPVQSVYEGKKEFRSAEEASYGFWNPWAILCSLSILHSYFYISAAANSKSNSALNFTAGQKVIHRGFILILVSSSWPYSQLAFNLSFSVYTCISAFYMQKWIIISRKFEILSCKTFKTV